MSSHYRMRDADEYEQEEYNDYEEDASEEEEEEEGEEPPSQEQQEFLRMREELKEKFRRKLKNEMASSLGRSQVQSKGRTSSDRFGSFFGPSQPVIASRVLDERRSIRETQHIISRAPNAATGHTRDPAHRSSEKKTVVHQQKSKFVNEVKKKAQTLKDMRDYSFLLSDDAEFPDSKEEQSRNVPASRSDGRSSQAPGRSKEQTAKPARPVSSGHARPVSSGHARSVSNGHARPVPSGHARPAPSEHVRPAPSGHARPASSGHGVKSSAAKNLQSQSRVGSANGASLNKARPATADPRKISNLGNNTGRPTGSRPLPSKAPAQGTGTSKHTTTVTKDPYVKHRPPSAAPHSSSQKNHYADQRRPSQSINGSRPVPKKPLVSSNSQLLQPTKRPLSRDSHEDRLRKKLPPPRRFDDDDDEDAIGMIRKMFGYNPAKYSAVDDDVSDMEANFDQIEMEEKRSALIAQKEDEEQLRLIEEEERRARMRKKQKLNR